MSKVVVLGAGQWGSTLAQVLSDAGNHVLIWGRDQKVVDEINKSHTNSKYLGENVLPVGLKATVDLKEAMEYSNIYVIAIPAQALRQNLVQWKSLVQPNATYISTLKGIEESSLSRMTEIIEQVLETLRKNNWITETEIEATEDRVKAVVEESVIFAEESPYPTIDELYKDVYVQEDYPYILD
jgi:glycerol-3-phosphate dehydrogenase